MNFISKSVLVAGVLGSLSLFAADKARVCVALKAMFTSDKAMHHQVSEALKAVEKASAGMKNWVEITELSSLKYLLSTRTEVLRDAMDVIGCDEKAE